MFTVHDNAYSVDEDLHSLNILYETHIDSFALLKPLNVDKTVKVKQPFLTFPSRELFIFQSTIHCINPCFVMCYLVLLTTHTGSLSPILPQVLLAPSVRPMMRPLSILFGIAPIGHMFVLNIQPYLGCLVLLVPNGLPVSCIVVGLNRMFNMECLFLKMLSCLILLEILFMIPIICTYTSF